jgi:hypothetical protein
LKLLKGNIRRTLKGCVGKNFLKRTPIAQEIRPRIDKWDCIKLKSLCTSKEAMIRPRDNPQGGRKPSQASHWTRIYIQNI